MQVSSHRKEECAALLPDLQTLSLNTVEPAGTNAPELILPLLKDSHAAELVTVTDNGRQLFSLAIGKMGRWRGISANMVTSLTFMGTPYLDRDSAERAWAAFLSAQNEPLLLQSLATAGPIWETIHRSSAHFAKIRQWQRAVLFPKGTFTEWFENNFERKRRKEFRRLQNRLQEQGSFAQLALSMESEQSWVEDFLALESKSWKGQRGTDIAAQPAEAAALRQACKLLHAAGKLRFWSLKLDGQTIATLFAIVEGDAAWLGKIAFDETYAKFSPGVLLILYATEQMMAEKNITMVDSCAIPGHPMIENIWRDRLTVADIMVAPITLAKWRFNKAVVIEKLRRAARSLAREIYYKLNKGKHRS